MPSKGILCSTYISVPDVSVEYTVPGTCVTHSSHRAFTAAHLEVDKAALGTFALTGEFSFSVRRGGRVLARQSVCVNAVTGRVSGGAMAAMDRTPALFVDDVAVAYGFYDAGPGRAGLPRQHQCYVAVTPCFAHWMRDAMPAGGEAATRMFRRVVLPAAHDVGMNSMATCLAALEHAGAGVIREAVGRDVPHVLDVLGRLGDAAVNRIAPDIIRALALTQKDSLDAMLKLGARYFEFRPARCHAQMQRVSPLEDTWYFQHGAIPGMLYREFLSSLVSFLCEHQDEIVVVHVRWDGVSGDCARPSDDELRGVLEDALKDRDLKVGDEADMMGMSVRDLRDEKKRLIVLQNVSQISNYDDVANATLTGDSMVDKLNDMARDPPSGHSVILLQCQATATNIRDVIVASVVDSDVSTSPILATKPICDAKILPLLRGDTGRELARGDGVVVVMNDFFEGATADVAIGMCKERLGQMEKEVTQ
jgi:hypothetical protein